MVWATTLPIGADVLGHHAELDDEVCREILRPDLAPLATAG
jgi:hypothetical protein